MNISTKKEVTAFTLIELLVVVAIISLLVSILLPSLKKAKELAKSAVCMNNMHSIGTLISFYSHDYSGHIAPPVDDPGTTYGNALARGFWWYILSYDQLTVPMSSANRAEFKSALRCPAQENTPVFNITNNLPVDGPQFANTSVVCNYGVNCRSNILSLGGVHNIDNVVQPSEKFYIGDCEYQFGGITDGLRIFPNSKEVFHLESIYSGIGFRHLDDYNMLFFDYHVQRIITPGPLGPANTSTPNAWMPAL